MIVTARNPATQSASRNDGQDCIPKLANKRLARERKTIASMIQCFCRDHHQYSRVLCPECQSLLDYATLRLDRCRFGAEKPTCVNCPVHCYLPKQREQVRIIMRYAGPKMLWRHPILAIRHILDGYRKAPEIKSPVRD